ncbi:MAG TPA: matrixin family metalloprotease [Patescibacteria group bacterium]
MKKFLLFLLSLVILGSIIYLVPSFHTKAAQMLTYNACNTPLEYSLGTIDKRFGLSSDEVLQDIQQAGQIWSLAEGKNLFVYSPNAKLTINFVYDERQALDSSINQLNSKLTQNNQTLSQQIAQYKSDYAAFRAKLDAFNATVDKYNSEGGAPKAVYDDLLKQQQELDAEGKSLNERARQLNISTDNYNYNVNVLNNDINQFQNVLTQKPEEGLYNGEEDTISIYFSSNKNELIHTLSHELGHSLGMMHVKDKNAIMYPYTTENLVVTPDDMTELSRVCRNQSLIIHDLQEFDLWLITGVQSLTKKS